ncbi:MAG: hypothetical protein ACFE9R_09970 [Candidatus Hermodarchaeota archaeon]
MNISKEFRLQTFTPEKKPKFTQDIYYGEEKIEFKNRHPIFKALMKLEFEEAIRKYMKR